MLNPAAVTMRQKLGVGSHSFLDDGVLHAVCVIHNACLSETSLKQVSLRFIPKV